MATLAAVVGIGQTKYQTKRGDVSIAGLVREGGKIGRGLFWFLPQGLPGTMSGGHAGVPSFLRCGRAGRRCERLPAILAYTRRTGVASGCRRFAPGV